MVDLGIDMFLVRLPYRGAKGQETLAHTVIMRLHVCVCARRLWHCGYGIDLISENINNPLRVSPFLLLYVVVVYTDG